MDKRGGRERYRKIRPLGEGGFGQVWLAEDLMTGGGHVALKEILDTEATGFQELRREFGLLARLHHPNLVRVYALDRDPESGRPRFSMEVIDGEPMPAAIENEGLSLLKTSVAEALRALAFLHEFNIVHCDLKPGNLLIRSDTDAAARLVLLDFGLSRERPAWSPGATIDPVSSGATVGTLDYLAPEIFAGQAPSVRSDLYSLAAVIHQAIWGEPPIPFGNLDLGTFLEKVRGGVRRRRPNPDGHPEGIRDWLDAMLSPDPSDRPVSAREALAGWSLAVAETYPEATARDRVARLRSGEPPGFEKECVELREWLSPEGPRVGWLRGAAGMGKRRLLEWWRAECLAAGWDARVVEPGTLEKICKDRSADERKALFVERAEELGEGDWHALRAVWAKEEDTVRLYCGIEDARIAQNIQSSLPAREGWLASIELKTFDEARVRQVARRARGGHDVRDMEVRRLLTASGGHPALLQAMLIDDNEFTGDESGTDPMHAALVRIDGRLPEDARRVLEWLSIGESGASVETLQSCCEGRHPDEALRELEAFGLVAYRAGDRWLVPSSAVRRFVLRALSYVERRKRALVLFEFSEENLSGMDEDPLARAHLARLAGHHEEALRNALIAAVQAGDYQDPVRGAEALGWARRFLPAGDERAVEFRMKQADRYRQANHMQRVARIYNNLLRTVQRPEDRAGVLARRAEIEAYAANFEDALRDANTALEVLGEGIERHPDVLGRVARARGICEARQGNNQDALQHFEQAIEIFEHEGDRFECGIAFQGLMQTYSAFDNEKTMWASRMAIKAFEDAGREDRTIICTMTKAYCDLRLGNYENATSSIQESLRLSQLYGSATRAVTARTYLAYIAYGQDRFTEALGLCDQAEDGSRVLNDWRLIAYTRNIRARVYLRAGQYHRALELAQKTLENPMDKVDSWIHAEAELVFLEARAATQNGWTGETIAALERLGEIEELDPDFVLQWTRTRIRAWAAEDLPRATALYRQTMAKAEKEQSWNQGYWLMSLELELARALTAGGETDSALVVLQSAEARTKPMNAEGSLIEILTLRAEIAEAEGKDAEAGSLRKEARALLEKIQTTQGEHSLVRGFAESPCFESLQRRAGVIGSSADDRLLAMYEMIRALNTESDRERLLESILDHAIKVVGAERGMILLRDPVDGALEVRVARNVEQETIDDAAEYSQRIVDEAGRGKAMLAFDAKNDERLRTAASVSLFGICSLMCVPLRVRDEIIGTVYLDDRREGRLFNPDDLRFLEAFADHASIALRNVSERAELKEENERLRACVDAHQKFEELVGASPAMQRVYELIDRVAPSEVSVLIHGETGTGKELVARAIHRRSLRSERPFVAENCAAMPETLLQSLLFGHVRGAFTGAERDHAGLFETADGGTLFLDEIGDMSPNMQAQLLRVLQEGEVRPVGSEKTISVDVRTVMATHRDLEREVEAGRFRADLLYRLQVMVISLPRLHERPGDVALLTNHFLQRISGESGRVQVPVTATALALLEAYAWPGNVRQLENTIRRLVVLAGDRAIDENLLRMDPTLASKFMAGASPAPAPAPGRQRTVTAIEPTGWPEPIDEDREERNRIIEALRRTRGNRSKAARLIGVSRATFYRKLEKHDL
jgi:Nif-specific regulatory protein